MNLQYRDADWQSNGKWLHPVYNGNSVSHANNTCGLKTYYGAPSYSNENIVRVSPVSKMFKMTNISPSESGNSADPTDHSRRKGESPFLVPFYNFYFYLYLVPFKLELTTEKSGYHLRKHKIHRIICVISHCLITASLVYMVVVSILQMVASPPSTLIVAIFEVISNLSCLVQILLLWHMFWRQEDSLLEIINRTTASYDLISPKKMNSLKRYVSILAIVLTIALMIITFFLLTQEGHYLSGNNNNNVTAPEVNPKTSSGDSTMEMIGGILLLAAFVYASAIFPLSQWMFPMMTMALRQLGRELEVDLAKTFDRFPSSSQMENGRITEGIKLFRKLKGTTESIKCLFGTQLLAFCVTSVTYYAEAPHVLLGKRGNVEKAVLVYFMLSVVAWYFAAEFHHNVNDSLFKWLETHADSCDLSTNQRLRLVSVQNEAASDPVALRNKYFTCTYGYLSSLLSLIITYGIIVFQLHQDDGPKVIDPRPPTFHS